MTRVHPPPPLLCPSLPDNVVLWESGVPQPTERPVDVPHPRGVFPQEQMPRVPQLPIAAVPQVRHPHRLRVDHVAVQGELDRVEE